MVTLVKATGQIELEKVGEHRGHDILYCAHYDSWNVADDDGGFIVDGCNSLEDCKRSLDYMLKPRRRDPRVGGLWDDAPLEYFTESSYED
jgi:hypothetical protein